jgi:hypothetical protein
MFQTRSPGRVWYAVPPAGVLMVALVGLAWGSGAAVVPAVVPAVVGPGTCVVAAAVVAAGMLRSSRLPPGSFVPDGSLRGDGGGNPAPSPS